MGRRRVVAHAERISILEFNWLKIIGKADGGKSKTRGELEKERKGGTAYSLLCNLITILLFPTQATDLLIEKLRSVVKIYCMPYSTCTSAMGESCVEKDKYHFKLETFQCNPAKSRMHVYVYRVRTVTNTAHQEQKPLGRVGVRRRMA